MMSTISVNSLGSQSTDQLFLYQSSLQQWARPRTERSTTTYGPPMRSMHFCGNKGWPRLMTSPRLVRLNRLIPLPTVFRYLKINICRLPFSAFLLFQVCYLNNAQYRRLSWRGICPVRWLLLMTALQLLLRDVAYFQPTGLTLSALLSTSDDV